MLRPQRKKLRREPLPATGKLPGQARRRTRSQGGVWRTLPALRHVGKADCRSRCRMHSRFLHHPPHLPEEAAETKSHPRRSRRGQENPRLAPQSHQGPGPPSGPKTLHPIRIARDGPLRQSQPRQRDFAHRQPPWPDRSLAGPRNRTARRHSCPAIWNERRRASFAPRVNPRRTPQPVRLVCEGRSSSHPCLRRKGPPGPSRRTNLPREPARPRPTPTS